MDIKQISVFLENKKGRLAEVTGILAKEGINIRALALADTAEFGILRLIVNDTDKAVDVLKDNNFVAQKTDVIAVEIEDKPGGLSLILKIFDENGINIEYMYAFVEKKANNAIVIFKIDDQKKAIESLKKNNISLLTNDILKSL
ncbi:MAG: ACT domain-containing protein [Spirochaetales bacterium]|nr:ACT domain-containing protein [Spirochaetales bacterium]